MLIERPPRIFRALFPGAIFKVRPEWRKDRRVFLTFDDGPIPEVTPWVLDVLDHYDIKATFFMVGQNVERHPELLDEVRRRGHSVGCHTMHHLQGLHVTTMRYLLDTRRSAELIGTRLFRPPHGLLRPRQARALLREYTMVMYDLVTRDYSRRLTPEQVFGNVTRYARPGSIIVFHDSLKSEPRLREALPRSIEWLMGQGYEFDTLARFSPARETVFHNSHMMYLSPQTVPGQ